MNQECVNDKVKTRVLEIFRAQREHEEEQRLSPAELVREGARVMLETALEAEIEECLGRSATSAAPSGGGCD